MTSFLSAADVAMMRTTQAASLPDICTILREDPATNTWAIKYAGVPCRIMKPQYATLSAPELVPVQIRTDEYKLTTAWNQDLQAADRVFNAGQVSYQGAVAAGSPAPTTTAFLTNLPSTVTDFYTGRFVTFTSGVLGATLQAQQVIAYSGATKLLTVAAPFSQAPAVGDVFTLDGVTYAVVNIDNQRASWLTALRATLQVTP